MTSNSTNQPQGQASKITRKEVTFTPAGDRTPAHSHCEAPNGQANDGFKLEQGSEPNTLEEHMALDLVATQQVS
jgi:hypothetical protein